MIVKSVKLMWSGIVTLAVLWFVFFVELGERTLFQHVLRIAQTEEAQDLGREVGEASRRLGDEVSRSIEESRQEGANASADGDSAPDSEGAPDPEADGSDVEAEAAAPAADERDAADEESPEAPSANSTLVITGLDGLSRFLE